MFVWNVPETLLFEKMQIRPKLWVFPKKIKRKVNQNVQKKINSTDFYLWLRPYVHKISSSYFLTFSSPTGVSWKSVAHFFIFNQKQESLVSQFLMFFLFFVSDLKVLSKVLIYQMNLNFYAWSIPVNSQQLLPVAQTLFWPYYDH